MRSPEAAPLPLISIIMPAYNCAAYLGDAIESVLSQSYPNWELILLDDASTDATPQVIQPYRQDGRIVYRRLEKVEKSSAARVRNLGLKQAQGEFIAFLDADDRFFPQALETLCRVLMDNPACKMIQGFYTSIDEDGNPIRTLGLDLRQDAQGRFQLPDNFIYNWATLLTVQFPCLLGTGLFRREVFERIGTFSEALSHSEDFEFFLRLFHHDSNSLHAIPVHVCQYRYNPQSLTKAESQYQQQLDCHFNLLDSLFQHAEYASAIARLKPEVYTRWFRLFARQQLNANRPALARQIIGQALKNPNVSKLQFLKSLGPLLIQSLLSPSVYRSLANLNRTLRNTVTRSSIQACPSHP